MSDSFPFFDHPGDFELPSTKDYESGICIVDGVVIKESLHEALMTPDKHAHVPVLAGSCSQEGHTAFLPQDATSKQFMEVVQKFVSNLTTARWPANATDRIAQLYPPTAQEFKRVPKAAMDAMVADIRVVCGTLENARRLVKGRQSQTTPDATDVWA